MLVVEHLNLNELDLDFSSVWDSHPVSTVTRFFQSMPTVPIVDQDNKEPGPALKQLLQEVCHYGYGPFNHLEVKRHIGASTEHSSGAVSEKEQ